MRRALMMLPMLVVAAGLLIVGCSSDDNKTTTATNTSSSTSTESSSAGPSSASGSGAAASATIKVATDPKFGQILVDADGKTVYLFAVETGTTSSCTGGCASVWPAVTAAGTPEAGDGVDTAKLGTAQGQVAGQVTYNGHLLYTFSGDSKPGDVNGVAIPSWFAVTPAGEQAS
jgi:predicted lipoprotein with Yx(FWY)xxD motif